MQADAQVGPPQLPASMRKAWIQIILVCVDFIMILVGFQIAFIVRFDIERIPWLYAYSTAPSHFYSPLMLGLTFVWIMIFNALGLYEHKNLFRGMEEYKHVFLGGTLGMMLVITFYFIGPDFELARGWLIVSWIFVSGSVMIGRTIFRLIIHNLRVQGFLQTNVLFVGADSEGLAVARQLISDRTSGIKVIGFVDDKYKRGHEILSGIRVLGPINSIERMVIDNHVEDLIVSSNSLEREQFIKLFQYFGSDSDVTVRISSGIYELLTTGVEVQEFGGVPLMSINKVRLSRGETTLKRLLDLFIVIPFLIIFAPVILAIALTIKFSSDGPIFHKRRVMGVGGETFHALKFRTMHVNADQVLKEILAKNPVLRKEYKMHYKLKNDPRITSIGKFLRSTSLDELPQLLNVLFGQMSLVGPRMITPAELSRYGKWGMNLQTVKPAITGLWQVSGRSNLTYEDRVRLDMYYIRNYSLWLDLYILLLTIPIVFKGHGAY